MRSKRKRRVLKLYPKYQSREGWSVEDIQPPKEIRKLLKKQKKMDVDELLLTARRMATRYIRQKCPACSESRSVRLAFRVDEEDRGQIKFFCNACDGCGVEIMVQKDKAIPRTLDRAWDSFIKTAAEDRRQSTPEAIQVNLNRTKCPLCKRIRALKMDYTRKVTEHIYDYEEDVGYAVSITCKKCGKIGKIEGSSDPLIDEVDAAFAQLASYHERVAAKLRGRNE